MGVKSLEFEVVAEEGMARRGVIRTPHGTLETPGFFAVATRAALKSLDPEAGRRSGVQALIANTYHLEMQPGAESVAAAGGLHRLMAWNGVLATDSGGFQVFSFRHGQVADEVKGRRRLPTAIGPAERGEEAIEPVRVDEDGVDFRSYIDGVLHRFTPESCMARQRDLGADVCFALDECTPFHVPEAYTQSATERNLRWARRCAEAFGALGMVRSQAFFGIVHGGVYPELRRWSAVEMAKLGCDGFGIGDCLGETKRDWYGVVDIVCSLLPPERPRHLLGVGEPDDLIEGALRGVDTFDCAMPTRIARHGQSLHRGRPRFRLDLTTPEMATDERPLEEGCDCRSCSRFTRAYVHHLFRARELLGATLVAEHNLRFTTRLLEQIRKAISARRLR